MAKKKKKERKNNKMPPLYWVDKLIYVALLVVAIVLLLTYSIFHFITIGNLYFRETSVVAYERHISLLWFIPTFFLLLGLIGFIYDKFRCRYPIFGIPKFLYGPSKYPRIYPIFSKDKPMKKITPKIKRNMLILWSILAAFMLTTLSTSCMGLFGRNCLYEDGSVAKYSVFNSKKEEYTTGEIAEINFFDRIEHFIVYEEKPRFWLFRQVQSKSRVSLQHTILYRSIEHLSQCVRYILCHCRSVPHRLDTFLASCLCNLGQRIIINRFCVLEGIMLHILGSLAPVALVCCSPLFRIILEPYIACIRCKL